MATKVLKKSALRIDQNQTSPLYVFSLTSDELHKIAGVSRVGRDSEERLVGYQRGEVRRHIDTIAQYLVQDDALLPNSIILALKPEVKFRSLDGNGGQMGTLEIPLPRGDEEKPGLIVDGQQRSMALRQSGRSDFPVAVNAFIASDLETQREQFVRVNSARPLPQALITELLTEIPGGITGAMDHRRLASLICDELNQRHGSPFRGLIRRPSSTGEVRQSAVITDTSVVNMIIDSLTQPSGCLFPHYNIATGGADLEAIISLVTCYWSAVKQTFPDAWGLPARYSRLTHGAGICAMGRLMDRVMAGYHKSTRQRRGEVRAEVELVAPYCRWTEGNWPELGLGWNEIQNTSTHVKLLSNFLVRAYSREKGTIS